ncbi:MAG: hypothetical protein ACHQLA_09320 [Ignavibacteriales bacterium]
MHLSRIYFASTILLLLSTNSYSYSQCGSERWPVKILEDSEANQINFTPKTSTVHKQLLFPKPDYHEANPREPTEKQVYKINCILVKYMLEDDSDWHLVVQDLSTGEKMVVEIPDPDCLDQSNPRFNKIELSRNRLKAKVGPIKKTPRIPPAGTRLQIIGIGFFDKNNHPVGFKGREIHPVLELKVLQ